MQIVTTHKNTDFDALASVIAATLLYPGSIPILPKSLNPNVKAHVAVNPDSELIPVTRSNGVLLALTAPTRGVISGKSAVLQLDGWTFEDLALQPEHDPSVARSRYYS